MINYIDSGKMPIKEYFYKIVDDIKKETNNLKFDLDNQDYNDAVIFNELFMNKNHYKIPSLTEIYIEKKKFKDSEKVKMLYAMRDSIVGLFKVIKYDFVDGYVTYQDVFTNKRYKIIDVSMSSLGKMYENKDIYIYNRIIKYDGILFGTGIGCVFTNDSKELRDFIKHHKYQKCSDFSRCLILYKMSKESEIGANNYNSY